MFLYKDAGLHVVLSILLLLLILPVQYSAFSGVPYPNCIDDLGETIILHWTGTCGGQPFFDNLKFFSDMGYHVIDSNKIANGQATTTLTRGIQQPTTDEQDQKSDKNQNSDSLQLPKTLSIKRPGYDLIVQIPLVAVIQNGNVTYFKDNYPERSILPLTTYNPVFEFQFREGSEVPLVNINQILLGEIKPYGNISEALKSTYIFKNIGFNQKTVLPLRQDGFNYMVTEVQFASNMTGVYAFAFESTPNDSNSASYVKSIQEQSRQQGVAFVNSLPTNISTNETFLRVSQSVMCHVTLSYGFQVCSEKETR
jgi:hypothetical protein